MNWKLYPNPAKSFAFISLSETASVLIDIYGIDGKLIKSIKGEAAESQNILLGTFNPGIYIVGVTIDKKTTTFQKLIIE